MEERTSFLKKRSKKLLSTWLRLIRKGSAQARKSFLVLFFKEEQAFFLQAQGLAGWGPSLPDNILGLR
jgi:hypothetical protein